MAGLGFRRVDRCFGHPDCDYLVEFPPAPIMIGRLHVETWTELETKAGRVRILSPSQCVMDRLAAFYHWGDRQCLDQALMVARRHQVELNQIETWSVAEGHQERFREFRRALKARRRARTTRRS